MAVSCMLPFQNVKLPEAVALYVSQINKRYIFHLQILTFGYSLATEDAFFMYLQWTVASFFSKVRTLLT